MRQATFLGPGLLCIALAGMAFGSPVPNEGPRRIVAPWEPVETVLVRWPPAHPGVVYREIDQAASLTFLIAGQTQRDAAISYCSALGIDPARLNFITTGQVSPWPRDWGPYCVLDESGELLITDPLWNGYPYASQYCAEPTSTFIPNNPADASANASTASGLGLTHAPLTFFATGGNLLTDGFGRAFSSCLLVTENLKIMSEVQLRADAESLMGITDWVILDNWETGGIQHIDCWAKFVDEETVLVKRPPAGHPEQSPSEANIALLESLTTPWGNTYTIIPIDCPPYDNGRLANYLNSYIVNDLVLVPLFGIDADETAMDVYREAMPGYRVVGVPSEGFYNYTDAVHCRTRSIHDREMLRIAHPRIRAAQDLDSLIDVPVYLDPISGADLIAAETRVHWREAGLAQWQEIPLEEADDLGERWHRALLPALSSPTQIEYFIEAADESGRRVFMPPVGEAGPVVFEIGPDAMAIRPQSIGTTVGPGQTLPISVLIEQRGEQLDHATVKAHYRTSDSNPFIDLVMSGLGDGLFEVTLPGFSCADAPSLFFTAQTSAGIQRRWPAAAGSSKPITIAEQVQQALLDAYFTADELPAGFSASGLWTVGESCPVPLSCEGTASPAAAFVDAQSCTYDTGYREQGALTIPAVSLDDNATSASLMFCHTLHTEATDFGDLGYDIASVIINGQTVRTLSDTLDPATVSIDLSPWIGETVQVSFRFDTVDEQYNNYPGWKIQNIRIDQTKLDCPTCPADVTGDGEVGLADLNLVLAQFGQSGGSADTNGDGSIDLADLNVVLGAFGIACQ